MYDDSIWDFGDDNIDPVTYFKKPNRHDWLGNWRVHMAIISLIAIEIFHVLICVSLYITSLVPHDGSITFGTDMFILSMAIISGFVPVLVLSFVVDRQKKQLFEIEEKIASKKTNDLWQDLESVIAGNLRLRRYAVADFYSKQLLRLSEQHGSSPTLVPNWLLSTDCWLSTAEYNKSLGWGLRPLCQTRGTLSLTAHALYFRSRTISFKVRLSDIKSMGISRYPLWLTLTPRRYIIISFVEAGLERTFHLIPSHTDLSLVWEMNKLVNKWYMHIYNADARLRRKNAGVYNKRPCNLASVGTFRAISIHTS